MLSHLRNAKTRRVSDIQALAWLNAIAEDNSGDESGDENVCEGLDQGRQIQDKFDLHGK